MTKTSEIRQVHVRVPAAMKKAVKIFCVREGTTEQAWVQALIEERLRRKAPDLWPGMDRTAPQVGKSKAR
jgi:hypothetical protein